MIEHIYSKVNPSTLLHIIVRSSSMSSERTDIVPSDNFIQCSVLHMSSGKTFRPHKHITKSRSFSDLIAQESWVVISGSVRCVLYDLNDVIVATPVLGPGDASYTLLGGHTYEILENNTVVFEYKTGPYEGQLNDKVFLL